MPQDMMTDEEVKAWIDGPKPRSRFDNSAAEDLEWGFLEDAELLEVLRSVSRYWANVIDDPMVDVDDLYQESLCFVSCRPVLQEQEHTFIRAHVAARLRDIAKACKRRVSLGLAGEPPEVYPFGGSDW